MMKRVDVQDSKKESLEGAIANFTCTAAQQKPLDLTDQPRT